MAGSISLPGLASGLPTTDLIKAIMDAEAIPQTLLKKKATVTQSTVTDLQSLNTKIAALVEAAKKAAKPENIHAFKTSTSDPSVTVAASGSAQAGSLDITVESTATSHRLVSGTMAAWPEEPATLTFVSADGTKTQVNAATTKIDDVVRAVNNSAAGVKATKVASGVDGSGNPLYRIQFTAAEPGQAASFQVHRGSVADVDAGTSTNLLDDGATTITQGADAKIKLYAGTAAEIELSSSSNTFSQVLPGVDITVSKPSTVPVNVNVETDAEAAAANAKAFTDKLSEVFGLIKLKSATTTKSDSQGQTTVTGGTFTGDGLVRQVSQQLHDAIQFPVNGVSPSEIGVSFNKDGGLEFDAVKFAKAVSENPEKVDALFSGVATRVQQAADQISNRYDGSITKKIQNQERVVGDLNKQIERWDDRLAVRKTNLERTYSALEVMINKLNSQMSSLQSSIDQLAPAKTK